jgi:hypothetical protein
MTEGECFGIHLEAENMNEAALLTRFGMNSTKELRYCAVSVETGGQFTAAIVVAKNKKATSEVPKR